MLPLKRTTEPLTKPVPFTAKTNAGSPTILLAGRRVIITGTGFSTVRLTELEVPPAGAGLKTVIGRVAAA